MDLLVPVKTDRNDARGIARLMRLGRYFQVSPDSWMQKLYELDLARRQIGEDLA